MANDHLEPLALVHRYIDPHFVYMAAAEPGCFQFAYPKWVMLPMIDMIKTFSANGWEYTALPFKTPSHCSFQLKRIVL